jgi:hypothetical protein
MPSILKFFFRKQESASEIMPYPWDTGQGISVSLIYNKDFQGQYQYSKNHQKLFYEKLKSNFVFFF